MFDAAITFPTIIIAGVTRNCNFHALGYAMPRIGLGPPRAFPVLELALRRGVAVTQ